MAEDFARAVDDGLRLSKRLYFGKDRAVAPPKQITSMEKAGQSFLPASPMVYAVIRDPGIVDNPDIPSYQPHVHGGCDPPALIPLHMYGISLEVDCYLDTAFITATGSWRVHCVMASRSCDCRIAIPMGEQGSLLGLEVEVPRKSYNTKLVAIDEERGTGKAAKVDNGGFLKPNIFTVTIPQVSGGSNLSVKIRWSQKLTYHEGDFTVDIPFCFPEYVTPTGKKISKKEKIQLNVNCGPGFEVLCKTSSHPLKELRRQAGNLNFIYETEILTWSSSNFVFTYNMPSSDTCGMVLLQSPSLLDIDQREMFCCYLLPGNPRTEKVFRKEVIFVVDISGSMRGKPLESTKSAIFEALSRLDSEDMFNIIAFNGETYVFSSALEVATEEAIGNATQWINMNFIAGGGTNILTPLKQATEMLSKRSNFVPMVFLITDGAVEDERHICNEMRRHLAGQGAASARIYTFGIGSFCNHYFLRMLSMIGHGQYEAAYDVDTIERRMQGLFAKASSIILADIALENIELEQLEVYPSQIPDVSLEGPLLISGRYQGIFPEKVKAKGIRADMGNFSVDLKVQKAKDIPLDKVLAKQQIELLTSQAWFSEDKELEAKIAKLSIQNNVPSEYTHMALLETERAITYADPKSQKVSSKTDSVKIDDSSSQKTITILRDLGVGFGNCTATAENISPGSDDVKPLDAGEIFVKAASNCCGKLCGYCCCMCCIRCCSKLNDQCVIAMTQLIGALSCLGCLSCCELCCGGDD